MEAKPDKEKADLLRLSSLRSERPPAIAEKHLAAAVGSRSLAGLQSVEVPVTLEWGRSQITVEEALQLGKGSLLRLDQHGDSLVDVRVSGRLFARGKLVVVGDTFGVQLIEFIDP